MNTQHAEVDTVKNLIEQWAQAVRDQDIPAILKNHAEHIVMYDVIEPFKIVGIDDYAETWPPFFLNTKSGIFDIVDLKVYASDTIAFCIAEMYCEGKVGNTFEPIPFRLTVGLEKVNGQWSIVHEHHSVPSD